MSTTGKKTIESHVMALITGKWNQHRNIQNTKEQKRSNTISYTVTMPQQPRSAVIRFIVKIIRLLLPPISKVIIKYEPPNIPYGNCKFYILSTAVVQ